MASPIWRQAKIIWLQILARANNRLLNLVSFLDQWTERIGFLDKTIDGFQSRDKTAILMHKTMANLTHVLHNNRGKFPKDFFLFVPCANMAAMTSGENQRSKERTLGTRLRLGHSYDDAI